WTERKIVDLAGSLEGLELLPGCGIPKSNDFARTGGRDQLAVVTEARAADERDVVQPTGKDLRVTRSVEDARKAVPADGEDAPAVRAERNVPDVVWLRRSRLMNERGA